MIPLDHLQCVTVQSQGLGLLKTWHQGERCSLQCVPRITYLLQPVWRKQRLIHLRSLQPALVGAAQCISMTPEGSCPSIPAFWILVWVLTHHVPVPGRTKCHSKEQTEDRDAQRRGAAHPHLLSRAARPQPWHQTFWEQNPLFSFKISVFKHTAHPHSPGLPTGYSHPSTKLASFHGRHFISHKIYTKHY